jgi:hypothetical protein
VKSNKWKISSTKNFRLTSHICRFTFAVCHLIRPTLGNGSDEYHLNQPIPGMGIADAEAEVFSVECRKFGKAMGVALNENFLINSLGGKHLCGRIHIKCPYLFVLIALIENINGNPPSKAEYRQNPSPPCTRNGRNL